MSKALSTAINLNINTTYTNTSDLSGGNDTTQAIVKNFTDTLATGTAIDCADRLYAATRTLSATTGEDLDLAASLSDAFGASLTFARVKMLYVALNQTTAGYTLQVGGSGSQTGATATTNQFINWVASATDIVNVRGGGAFLLYTPDVTAYAVTAATGDLLKVYNPNAGTVSYDIIVIGAST